MMTERTMYNRKGEVVTREEYRRMGALEKAEVRTATNRHYDTMNGMTTKDVYGGHRYYRYAR